MICSCRKDAPSPKVMGRLPVFRSKDLTPNRGFEPSRKSSGTSQSDSLRAESARGNSLLCHPRSTFSQVLKKEPRSKLSDRNNCPRSNDLGTGLRKLPTGTFLRILRTTSRPLNLRVRNLGHVFHQWMKKRCHEVLPKNPA